MMKKKFLTLGLLLAGVAACFQSCDNDTDDVSKLFPNAVVTIKPNSDNSQMQLQLDDHTLLTPTNVKASKYGNKELRAIANLSDIDLNNKTAFVNWIDSIPTMATARNYNAGKNDSVYGNDPVELINSFETSAEDGYLTLHYRTIYGSDKPHRVNLVHRTDANTPYLLTLYHDGHGERRGRVGDGYVAFRLPQVFNEGNDTISIMLMFKSFSVNAKGDSTKTVVFKYIPRKK